LLRRLDVTHRAYYEPDFVLALDHQIERHQPQRPLIGLNHSAVPFVHDHEHREKALTIYSQVARELTEYGFVYVPHTVHFSQADQNDVDVGKMFERRSKGVIQCLAYPPAAEDLVDVYSCLTCAIGWRYHLNVISELVGIPSAVVCQNDEHKYRAFAIEQRLPIFDFDAPEKFLIDDICSFLDTIRSEERVRFWTRQHLRSGAHQVLLEVGNG
jgi:hypothetical protein